MNTVGNYLLSKPQEILARNIKLWIAVSDDIKNQSDLAARLGVSRSLVHKWLAQESWIGPDNLEKLAKELNITIDQLFVEHYEIRPK